MDVSSVASGTPPALHLDLALLEGRTRVAVPPALVRQCAGLAADCGPQALAEAFRAHAVLFGEAARGQLEDGGWAPAIELTEVQVARALQRLDRAAG